MNITLLDDHKLLSQLLKLSLLEFDFVNSVNIYNSSEQFIAHQDILKTDVLIVDMLMPEISGIEVIKQCRKAQGKSAIKILVLTTVIDANMIKDALQAGANGYLCKDASIEELTKAIRFIFTEEHKSYIGNSIKDSLLQAQLFETVKFNLSPREKELLQLICHGRTMKEISGDLDLSKNTVQSYMKQLMRKMEVNRTPDLILKALKFGLFHPSCVSYL